MVIRNNLLKHLGCISWNQKVVQPHRGRAFVSYRAVLRKELTGCEARFDPVAVLHSSLVVGRSSCLHGRQQHRAGRETRGFFPMRKNIA